MSTRRLLNLIDHLPATSAYQVALAQDDELAEQYVDDEDRPYRPSLSDWSATNALLATLVDRVAENTQAVIAAGGQAPPSFQSWPRPETAADRVRRIRQKKAFDDLLDLVEASKKQGKQQLN